jgi:hypothetical protein
LPVASASTALLNDIYLFMVSTQTVKSVNVEGKTEDLLDVAPLLNSVSTVPFSPCIKKLELCRCHVDLVCDDSLKRAAEALKTLTTLTFTKCRIPGLFSLVEKLPSLTSITCSSRLEEGNVLSHDFGGETDLLGANSDLNRFCNVIERHHSSLVDVRLDLVRRDNQASVTATGDRSFPAIERLLRGSKGVLAVNLGNLPWYSREHVVRGVRSLRDDLKTLRIRLFRCGFADGDYAAVLREVRLNRHLASFELGFDTHANLGTPELSIAAIRDLLASNDTLQALSLRGFGTVAAVALLGQVVSVLSATNRSLRILTLHDLDLTESWTAICATMLAMLEQNRVFSQLDGCKIPAGDPDAIHVRHLLKQNFYGRRFLLEPARAPITLWPTVLGRISDASEHAVMYAFLRANPGVVRSRA